MPAPVVEELTTLAGLEALRPEWGRLWATAAAAGEATPFQSPAWLVPWWRHFGRGAPLVLALRHDGQLVGVAPFYSWRGDGRPRLLLLGSGNTDHLDALFAPGFEASGAAAVVARLARERDAWEACDLQHLRPTSPLLAAAAPPELAAETWKEEPCLVARLPREVGALPIQLRRGLHHRLDYGRRRAARLGRVRFEAADARSLPELLDALFRLHGSRWAARAEPGVLADGAVRAFLREAAAELLAIGALRLYALRLDERIIAAHFGMGDGRREYYYIGGFDPAFEKLSPGALVVAHAMEEAVRAGAREFDFLQGRERYKYDWGATDEPSYRRVLHGGRGQAVA
jgi:CelD/BcsL family acetyltransferase involved in cellulose biosynthesis